MELTRLKELMATRIDESVITEASKKQEADFDGIRNVVEDALADLNDKIGKGGNLATLFKESGASKLDTYKDSDGKNVLAQILAKVAAFKKDISSLMTEAELLVNQAQMSEGVEMEDDEVMITEGKYELSPKMLKMGYSHKDVGYYICSPDGDTSGPYKSEKAAQKEIDKDVKASKTPSKDKIKFGVEGNEGFKKLKAPVAESQDLMEAKEYSDSSDFTDEFYGIVGQVAKMKQAMKNPRWMGWMKTTDDNFGTDTQTPARSAITAINSLDAQLSDIDDEFDKAN